MSKYQAICPACGAFGAPELFLAEAVKREALAKALRMPHPLALQVQAYIGLFRPKQRGHTLERVDRLLGELLRHLEPERVTYKGRTLPAPLPVWLEALDEVLERSRAGRLDLPLENHRYLLSVVLGKADRLEAEAERKREEQARQRPRLGSQLQETESASSAMEKWKQDMQRLGREDLIPKGERGR